MFIEVPVIISQLNNKGMSEKERIRDEFIQNSGGGGVEPKLDSVHQKPKEWFIDMGFDVPEELEGEEDVPRIISLKLDSTHFESKKSFEIIRVDEISRVSPNWDNTTNFHLVDGTVVESTLNKVKAKKLLINQ